LYLKNTSPESIQKAKAELELAVAKDALDPAMAAEFARLAIIQKQIPTALDSIRCISVSDPLFGKRVVSELAEEFPEFSPNLESNAHLLEPTKRDASCHLTSYTESAAHLTATASARPLTAAESLSLAESRWQLGEYTAALNALQKPAQDPANSAARYWMFLTTRALARQTLQAAVVQDPDSYRAHLVLADIAKDSGDTAKAEAEYAKAAETGASDPEVQLIYIQFLESIKKDSRAVDGARAAVARFPTNAKLNLELGQLLLKAGEPKTAASCFQRSLAADPDLIAARVGLADSYSATGFPDRAITEIKPALATDRDGSLYYRIARWYQQTGHMAEASQAFATTKKLKNEAFKRDVEKLHGDR
jgi:Tfp pilus assembly protein PilF